MDADGSHSLSAKRGITGGTLKYIAIIAMVIDHAAYAFLPEYYGVAGSLLHFVGRITGPTMFFFMSEGYHYTRNKNRYTLRLVLFAIVSWLPFVWYMGGGLPGTANWWDMSVIYTLLLGHLALRALHEVKNVVLRWLLIVVCFVASGIGDWGYWGVAIVLIFDIFRGNFRYQAIVYSIIVAARALPHLFEAFGAALAGQSPMLYLAQTFVRLGMFLPLILLRFYNGEKGRGSKWFFYIFYPAHLIVIALIRMLVS